MDLEIVTTSDGSHTLRNTRLNETYHSLHGAVRESMHVFVHHGLDFFRTQKDRNAVSVLEVGFGTGLNAFLTLQFAVENNIHVSYTTIEAHPLTKDVWEKLNYGAENRNRFEALHYAPWEEFISIAPQFGLHKVKIDLQVLTLNSGYDVIYFDAFAPSVQPDMWSINTLGRVTAMLNEDGVFVTYSAKGQLKRDLRALGLDVETLAGPPGKNEMVRAVKRRT